MNNYLVIEEEKPVDVLPWLRNKESEIVRIIEVIGSLSESKEWSTLKKYVFDGVLENLERKMATESNRVPLDEKEIYRLQGQIMWAKKYSKLETLLETYRSELINVRKQLNPPTERELAPDTL